ncbi:MAG TPA: efflux RND transporter periplasmic adaptor subunit [Gemmatimonadales bacterium]|nr:efflux RND transporter periplasmic adaptor subunit [Gemmatimonadales bacterium]
MSQPIHPPAPGAAPDLGAAPFGHPIPAARRRLVLLAGVAGLAALALGAYLLAGGGPGTPGAAGHDHATAPAADSARPVMLSATDRQRIGITFAPVSRGPLERSVRTVAQVTYDETRVQRVVPRVDGYVEQLFVNYTGQTVARGQPLFALYSPMLVTAQQELLLAQRLTEQVAGGTPDAVQGAQDLLESARRRLLYWEVPPGVIDEVLRTGTIQRTVTLRSPVAGVVVEKPVLAGQRIMAGEVAYQIADLSRVWLEGEVFEPDLPSVRIGQTVTAEFPALPGEEWTGRITYLYPTLDPETRTARVRVELANPALRFKPGMYATFRFSARTPPVLSVPRSAVLATGKRTLVFVREPSGALTPREVTPGRATDDRIEILRGLTEGETVVASATFLVDAESNLGSALAGMATMPGMEVSPPPEHTGHDRPPDQSLPAVPSGNPTPIPPMPGMPADRSARE